MPAYLDSVLTSTRTPRDGIFHTNNELLLTRIPFEDICRDANTSGTATTFAHPTQDGMSPPDLSTRLDMDQASHRSLGVEMQCLPLYWLSVS